MCPAGSSYGTRFVVLCNMCLFSLLIDVVYINLDILSIEAIGLMQVQQSRICNMLTFKFEHYKILNFLLN